MLEGRQCGTAAEETVRRTWQRVRDPTGARVWLHVGEAGLPLPHVGEVLPPKDHANSRPAG